jgi:hypothetical protein
MTKCSKSIIQQALDIIPKGKLAATVKKYSTNKRPYIFTLLDHLMVMVFAQLTSLQSLREIVGTLNVHPTRYQQIRIEGIPPTRSTLARINETQDYHFFE